MRQQGRWLQIEGQLFPPSVHDLAVLRAMNRFAPSCAIAGRPPVERFAWLLDSAHVL